MIKVKNSLREKNYDEYNKIKNKIATNCRIMKTNDLK